MAMKIVITLDEIGCDPMAEIGDMIERFKQFIRDQFDFEIYNRQIDFDLPNNEISAEIEVI
jgi:hypothetical protein